MRERWAGPIVVVLILGGVIAFLALNLNLKGRSSADSGPTPSLRPGRPPTDRRHQRAAGSIRQPADFREYPIGDEVEKNGMLIKAVWLPPIQMEGMDGPDLLEPDPPRGRYSRDRRQSQRLRQGRVRSLPGRALHDLPGGREIAGGFKIDRATPMTPMVARDGLHYGATIEAPPAGHYKLTYAIEPPSAGGLGRHVDRGHGRRAVVEAVRSIV